MYAASYASLQHGCTKVLFTKSHCVLQTAKINLWKRIYIRIIEENSRLSKNSYETLDDFYLI